MEGEIARLTRLLNEEVMVRMLNKKDSLKSEIALMGEMREVLARVRTESLLRERKLRATFLGTVVLVLVVGVFVSRKKCEKDVLRVCKDMPQNKCDVVLVPECETECAESCTIEEVGDRETREVVLVPQCKAQCVESCTVEGGGREPVFRARFERLSVEEAKEPDRETLEKSSTKDDVSKDVCVKEDIIACDTKLEEDCATGRVKDCIAIYGNGCEDAQGKEHNHEHLSSFECGSHWRSGDCANEVEKFDEKRVPFETKHALRGLCKASEAPCGRDVDDIISNGNGEHTSKKCKDWESSIGDNQEKGLRMNDLMRIVVATAILRVRLRWRLRKGLG